MTIRALLTDGKRQWEGKPAADEASIQKLLAWCQLSLPSDYLEMLRVNNGGHAFIEGYPEYVRFWSTETVIEYNVDYEIVTWLPGFIGFADNGGPDFLAFDTRTESPWKIYAIPFAPMEVESAIFVADDFYQLIHRLLPR